MPVHGTSLAYTFATEAKAEPSRKAVQYFEMYGHRGIWADGWKAVAFHPPGKPFEEDQWELYHLENDFSECKNLAKEKPEKLKEMVDLWWSEAERYGALPLDDRRAELWRPTPRSLTPRNRRRYVLYPPVAHMTGEVSPALGNRSFVATAEVERPTEKSEGAIFALGTGNNGMAFYVLGDRLVFDYNLFTKHCKAISDRPVPKGKSTLAVKLEKIGDAGPCDRVDRRRRVRQRGDPKDPAHDLVERHGRRLRRAARR